MPYSTDSDRPATLHTQVPLSFSSRFSLKPKNSGNFNGEELSPDHYMEILIAIPTLGYLLLYR